MPEAEEAAPKILVAAEEARRLVQDILKGNGVSPDNAATVARCLVAADLRGVDTHGMNRIPSYMERIRQGVLDAGAQPELKQPLNQQKFTALDWRA
jgi:LDH2 family malate/lactate/ureidoglycolate dehydrogenase